MKTRMHHPASISVIHGTGLVSGAYPVGGFKEGNTTTPGDFVVERAFVEK